MDKMAIFVEGYTEQAFVDRLVTNIANAQSVQIVHCKIRGGTTCRRRTRIIQTASKSTGMTHFIIIYDCGNDDLVKSRMMEEYENLSRAGYTRIVCMRDVRPRFSFADIPKLEAGLKYHVKTKPIEVQFILAVMEAEAWFLAEHNHFRHIDSAITVAAIKSSLGFDPSQDDMQLRQHPSRDLNDCYAIAAKSYEKGDATVSVLDFAYVYLELVGKFRHLQMLCDTVSSFLSPSPPR